MKKRLKVAQFGLGPIGLECLKLAASKEWVDIIGAVDLDPRKTGKDLRDLVWVEGLRSFRVVRSFTELQQKPDLIFHTTVSRFPAAYEQVMPILHQGINVVSSCEELAFPSLTEPRMAAAMDRIATRAGVRVIGTGVNPGFVMDLLPICMARVTGNIRSVHVERVVDASTRREPLQRKIGSGLEPAEFRRLLRTGKAGHAGLKESIALIALGLGYKHGKISETADAVVAREDIHTTYLEVRKGQTCGLHQRAEMRIKNQLYVTLDLKMFLRAPNPHDFIRIEGEPPVELLIQNGLAGDTATVAALVNTAPLLMRSKPGLRLSPELAVA